MVSSPPTLEPQTSRFSDPTLWAVDSEAAITLNLFQCAQPGVTDPKSALPGSHHVIYCDRLLGELKCHEIALALPADCRIDVVDGQRTLAEFIFGVGNSAGLILLSSGLPYQEWAKGHDSSLEVEEAIELAKFWFANLPELEARIKLEALRQRAKMAPYDWGQIVKQIHSPKSTGLDQLLPYIDELIARQLSQSELELKIWELSSQLDRKPAEIQRLYAYREQEKERNSEISDDSISFNQLTKTQEVTQKLDWSKHLPEALLKGLLTKAEASRIELVFLLQHLFPAIGGLMGSRIGIVAQEGATDEDSWIEYPIIWAAVVAEPSSGKTNAERTIFKPIRKFQEKEADGYESRKQEYHRVLDEWQKKGKEEKKNLIGTYDDPDFFKEVELGTCPKFLLDEGEIEAIKRRVSEQAPNSGLTWISGEFLRIWNSLDQYKHGKGTGRQFMLDAWSNPLAGYVDRVNETESFRFRHQTLSLCGGIQPGPAAKFFNREGNNSDDDGLWSRMLLAVPKLHPDIDKWSEVKVSVDDLLTDLYKKILKLPPGLVRLSPEAKQLWIKQWERYKRGYRDYLHKNPAFAYFLGKMCSNLMRIALIVQAIEHCYSPKFDFFTLDAKTFKKAKAIADYYIGQFRLCQSQFTQSPEEGLSEFMLQILNLCEAEKEITASRVVRKWRRKGQHGKAKSLKAAEVLELFQAIADAKPDLVEFTDRKLKMRSDVIKCDQPDRIPKPLKNGHPSPECDQCDREIDPKTSKNDPNVIKKNDHMITSEAEMPVVEAKNNAIGMITSDHIRSHSETPFPGEASTFSGAQNRALEAETLVVELKTNGLAPDGLGKEQVKTTRKKCDQCDRILENEGEKCDQCDRILEIQPKALVQYIGTSKRYSHYLGKTLTVKAIRPSLVDVDVEETLDSFKIYNLKVVQPAPVASAGDEETSGAEEYVLCLIHPDKSFQYWHGVNSGFTSSFERANRYKREGTVVRERDRIINQADQYICPNWRKLGYQVRYNTVKYFEERR